MDLEKGQAFIDRLNQDGDEINTHLGEVVADIRCRISDRAKELLELGCFPTLEAFKTPDQLRPERVPLLEVAFVSDTSIGYTLVTTDGSILECNIRASLMGQEWAYNLPDASPVSDEDILANYKYILATMSKEATMALVENSKA